MKIFAKSNIWKKIVIAFIVIAIISIISPGVVKASFGGELLKPVGDFFVALADGINALIHKIFIGSSDVLFEVSTVSILRILIAVVVAIGVLAIGIATGGLFLTITGLFVGALVLTTLPGVEIEFPLSQYITAEMFGDDTIYLPTYSLTPYEIFSNEQGIFSVNFFDDTQDAETMVGKLRSVISDWYVTLRWIAIVGMMSVLVYIGIRIIISSTAESKAKYKQMLGDWFVAMILLFVIHYIMVFANLAIDKITDVLKIPQSKVFSQTTVTNDDGSYFMINDQGVECFVIGGDSEEAKADPDSKDLVEAAWDSLVGEDENSSFKDYFLTSEGDKADNKDDASMLIWPADNYEVQARIKLQIERNENGVANYSYVGWALIYIGLVIYTCIFIYVYIKRLLYMSFLTLIAPLVALTYPIDRIKDGQAQAFNFWFREYFYNLMLQPLHLFLYMILIGSAMEFAGSNPIYVFVCLGFMVVAEKLVKQMFGFKGTTPGSMPGMAAGALIMNGARRLMGNGHGGKDGNNGGNSGKSENKEEYTNARTQSTDPYHNENLFGGNDSPTAIPEETSESEETGGLNESEETGGLNESEETGGLNESDEIGGLNESDESDETGGSNESDELDGTGGSNESDGTGESTNTSRQNSKNHRSNKTRKGYAAIHTLGAGGKKLIRENIFDKDKKGLDKVVVGKKALRLAKGAAGATIGAAVGGIAGMVTGDASKVLEYGMVGGTAGAKAFSGIGRNLPQNLNATADYYNQRKYDGNPEARKAAQVNANKKKFLRDEEQLNVLRNNLNEKQYKALMDGKKGARGIDAYIEHGFTDAKDIAAGEFFMYKTGKSREDAMDIVDMYKKNGNSATLTSDQRANMQRKFQKAGCDATNATTKVEEAADYLDVMSKMYGQVQ